MGSASLSVLFGLIGCTAADRREHAKRNRLGSGRRNPSPPSTTTACASAAKAARIANGMLKAGVPEGEANRCRQRAPRPTASRAPETDT